MRQFDLDVELDENMLQESYERNHFRDSIDDWEYKKSYEELAAVVKAVGIMKRMNYEEINSVTHVTSEYDGEFIVGIITLGMGVDQYELEQNASEDYSAVYRLDCLALDLLSASYESFRKQVERETGKYMSHFQFLGEDFPVELIGTFLEYLESEKYGIVYNKSYMIQPKKTVVFLSELSSEKTNCSASVCNRCSNSLCTNRKEELK